MLVTQDVLTASDLKAYSDDELLIWFYAYRDHHEAVARTLSLAHHREVKGMLQLLEREAKKRGLI